MIATSQELVSTAYKWLKREVHALPLSAAADAGIRKKKIMYEHLLIQEMSISRDINSKGPW